MNNGIGFTTARSDITMARLWTRLQRALLWLWNKDVDKKADGIKVEDVVLKDGNYRLGVNAKTCEWLLTVEEKRDIA